MKLLKLLSFALIFQRQVASRAHNMDLLRNFQNISWCKPDWCFPSMGKETNELLKQCTEIPRLELSDDIEEIIRKSNEFPIPFPVDTMRMKTLKERRPIDKLKKNVASTYPLIHERVLLLITHFLTYKREFGTSIEKALYKEMTVPEFIDRLLKKRAVVFMGPRDKYKLLTGEEDKDGWEAIGTLQQKPPLVLENCLSYDELKISSMVYVSGHTACINDGTRHNKAKVKEDDIETEAVIIGVIGPRFKRKFRMEYEDALITKPQNTVANGYGSNNPPTPTGSKKKCPSPIVGEERRNWRKMWAEFYEVHSYTYEELTSYVSVQDKPEEARYTERYVKVPRSNHLFDNEVYYKRLTITCECALLEAEARAAEEGRDAFVNIIGAGLGVWKISPHQVDVYVLTFLERIRALLKKDHLNHVSDVNFAYIAPSSGILALFTNATSPEGEPISEKKIFFESKRHPRGGINVQLENREPSAKLTGEHAGKLLVMTYPWDGNAHPGNEFWIGSLDGSGDPAAACSTQVSELHNAHINDHVTGNNTRVVGRAGLATLLQYTASLST
ncbi:uncharacterized protein LOC126377533 isoform X2 [Pectinophora gossypiella]|uniref:uncharacterized protein LOC126377533 isoform X2 n=1 Tax=Pectinophora gossypiella TaxID=13191 RepID=UPI00214E21CA|nr:uncharacterized protein LOC126377533 isoform X2 [Pectinophora gossypiella]